MGESRGTEVLIANPPPEPKTRTTRADQRIVAGNMHFNCGIDRDQSYRSRHNNPERLFK